MLAFVLPTCALDLTDPGTLSTTFDHIRPVLSSIAGDDYPLLQTGLRVFQSHPPESQAALQAASRHSQTQSNNPFVSLAVNCSDQPSDQQAQAEVKQDAFAMTTISPAGVHRPPNLQPPASNLLSLKRQASSTPIESTNDKALGRDVQEKLGLKRQKVESPESAAPLSIPAYSHPVSAIPDVKRFSRPQDVRRFPLEFVDGFFVGSEGIQETLLPSPVPCRPSPPLLPQRPWKHNLRARKMTEGSLNNSGVRKRNDMRVQNMPYKIEPPRDTPRFMTGKIADFTPWMGNHPEDILSDQTVKHGFIDRISVSQTETNTARQSLYGPFKHKPGLHHLSALFGVVFEERQAHTKIAPGAPFKPPPRVTLTEAKRKAWLSDLADPAVSLRKLSRTIPQGIRGQSLLDQCVANSVPIGRALWFTKCVAANEIRTLKRKGTNAAFATGTEIKWLREWTTNVEQFLESSIQQCGQADWRPRMNYALGLAVRLYSQSLLDRDHYLDWIVKSISTADRDHVPVWLLMVHLHKVDLMRHRKRGRSLVESSLEIIRTATEYDRSALTPLVIKLNHVLRLFIQTNPDCFVMPQSWKKYESTVGKCLDLRDSAEVLSLQQISQRNAQLLAAARFDSSQPPTPQKLVIDVLDSAKSPFNIDQIRGDCRSACHDTDVIVKTVLEWSSTRFRTGDFRVYLAVGLIDSWRGEIDITSTVIDFLASQQTTTSGDTHSLCQLVSELVGCRLFSLSKYLQWLTARGGLQQSSSKNLYPALPDAAQPRGYRSSTGFGPADVLAAVPLSILTPAVRNLRNNMLARTGFSIDDETRLISSCKDHIARQLTWMSFHGDVDSSATASAPDFSQLSWSVRVESARCLLKYIVLLKKSSDRSTTEAAAQPEAGPPLADVEFRVVRDICEKLGQLPVLADIINICMTTAGEDLLASITDTVNFHLDAFSALGRSADIHTSLCKAYLSMRARSPLPRHFVLSLISLGSVTPSHLVSMSVLQQDLATGDKNLAVVAYSPVSDGMAESLQQAGPTFVEEFEAVLSSGNRMEEQTMTQLFNVMAERLEKGQYQIKAVNDEILCILHARLRIYGIAQFDVLLAAWLKRFLTTANSRVKQLLPILITTNCISFTACVDIFHGVLSTADTPVRESLLMNAHAIELVDMINAAEDSIDSVSYKLKLENARHTRIRPDRAFDLLIRTGLNSEGPRMQQSNEILVHVVLRGQALEKLSHTDSAEAVVSELDNILQLHGEDKAPSNFAISKLVKETNDFSMRFCRLRFQLWAANTSPSSSASQKAIVETLFDLAKSGRDDSWMYCLSAIGHEAACQVREKAEDAFFSLPLHPALGRNTSTMSPGATYIEQAGLYLKIISCTAYSIPPAGVQSIVPTLVERLALVLRGLNISKVSNDYDASNQTNNHAALIEGSSQGCLDHLTSYLVLLLQIISIHRGSFFFGRAESLSSPVPSAKHNHQDVVKVLVLLSNIALHPSLDSRFDIVSHVFDVAATILDDASEEARTLCARILKDRMRHPRIDYLFGSASNARGVTSSVHGSRQAGFIPEGLQIVRDGKRVGEYKPRTAEMLEGGAEPSISLSLFDARREA